MAGFAELLTDPIDAPAASLPVVVQVYKPPAGLASGGTVQGFTLQATPWQDD